MRRFEREDRRGGAFQPPHLVQIQLREPPERIPAICESFPHRRVVVSNETKALDPGVRLGRDRIAGVGREQGRQGGGRGAACRRDAGDRRRHLYHHGRPSRRRGVQQIVGGGDDGVDADAFEAVRHVPAAALGRQAHAPARAARQIDSENPLMRAERSVPKWIRRAEQRDKRCADRRGQMHRPGVTRDEQVQTGEQRGQRRQIECSTGVDHGHARQRLDEPHRRAADRRASP